MNRETLILSAVFFAACGTALDGAEGETVSTVSSEVRSRSCETALTAAPPSRSMKAAIKKAQAECPYCTVLTLDLFTFDCALSTATQDDVVAIAVRVAAAMPEGDVQWSTGTARGMTAADVVNEFGADSSLATFFQKEVKGEISGVAIVGSADPDARNDLIAVCGSGAKKVYVVTRQQQFP